MSRNVSPRVAVSMGIALVWMGCAPNPAPVDQAPAVQYGFVMPPPGTLTDLNAYRSRRPPVPAKSERTRSRLAKNCANCWTDVTIRPYDKSDLYGPHDNKPPVTSWVPVAHIVNAGPSNTVRYDLEANTSADYDVYLANEAGVVLYKIVRVPVGASGELTVVESGLYLACGHEKKPKAEADFRSCKYDGVRITEGPALLRLASADSRGGIGSGLFDLKFPRAAAEDPGWLACTSGCCTMGTAN